MDAEKEPLPPDELRCNRNDGRGWRCKKLAVAGKTFCVAHLHRLSQKKTPKNKEDCNSTPGESNNRRVTRESVRIRVKPEPVDDDTQVVPYMAREGVVVAREKGLVEKRRPRVQRFDMVGVVEGRENGVDEVMVEKRGNVVADVEEREKGSNEVLVEKRGNVGADVEERENGDVAEMRGPRVKRVNLSSDEEVRENGNVKAKVKGKKFMVEEGLAEELRCTRNDGREWRCKRRVVEGQPLCEAHYKGIKLINVKAKTGNKRRKKSKKGSELVVKKEQ